ncbi:hypothetical protein HanIR_Chr12g0601691 [Helianthus annuus]|nr:hypothetical protein HanIR_Chr12g0601691 [Helianthus annuus]
MITCTFIVTGIHTTDLVRGRSLIDTARLVTHGKPPLIFAHMPGMAAIRILIFANMPGGPRYKYN